MVRYQHEVSTCGTRLAQVKKGEELLSEDKAEFLREKHLLQEEFDKLHTAGKELQDRSKDIEGFAMVLTVTANSLIRLFNQDGYLFIYFFQEYLYRLKTPAFIYSYKICYQCLTCF